jgi:hypothetical protein
VVAVVAGVLVIGSVAEINAQSAGYRATTNAGYGALATRVVEASNQTGSRLATLMDQAPTLPNKATPEFARSVIQQVLDQAVAASAGQARQVAGLAPPYPTGNTAERLTGVLTDRATAVARLRNVIDRQLGMAPLPVAGSPDSPTTSATVAAVPEISVAQAATELAAVGLLFQRADDAYRVLAAADRADRAPVRLPRSVWVPLPVASAPLGSVRLGATAAALAASPALAPFHEVIISAVGLSPPAVASGGPGAIGDGCGNARVSTVPGASPTVVPPTTTLRATTTVTNCGTVVASPVTVTQTVALADPAGTAPPPAGDRGGTATARVDVAAGGSAVVPLPAVAVAGGHRYTLTLSVPPGTAGSAGTVQQFLIQIVG